MKLRLLQPDRDNATAAAVTLTAKRRMRDAALHSPMPDDATRLSAVRRPFLDGRWSVKDPKSPGMMAFA
ncbi:hypothetical protein ACWDA3_09105 [Nonomuraea rubra]